MYHTFTKKVLPLPEKIISGFGIEELIDKNHWIIQIFKIPLNDPPTLGNLLKIAIYNGLLQVNIKSNDLPEGIVKAYKDLKMHNMINYISRSEYDKLLSSLPSSFDKDLSSEIVNF